MPGALAPVGRLAGELDASGVLAFEEAVFEVFDAESPFDVCD